MSMHFLCTFDQQFAVAIANIFAFKYQLQTTNYGICFRHHLHNRDRRVLCLEALFRYKSYNGSVKLQNASDNNDNNKKINLWLCTTK